METEKRLIDANALAENWFYTNDTGTQVVELLEIEQAPTVDAVEVVRCKDCKHYLYDDFDGAYVCMQLSKYVKPDFWCAHGERKDDD